MAAETRTTVAATWASFLAWLKAQLPGQTGTGSTLAIRTGGVYEGNASPDAYAGPFVCAFVTDIKTTGLVGADKTWEVTARIRVVSRTTAASVSAVGEILAKIALVQNKLESFALPAGVSGFNDVTWSITYDASAESGSTVYADCVCRFSIIATKGSN
jgi:hypothetical protein